MTLNGVTRGVRFCRWIRQLIPKSIKFGKLGGMLNECRGRACFNGLATPHRKVAAASRIQIYSANYSASELVMGWVHPWVGLGWVRLGGDLTAGNF